MSNIAELRISLRDTFPKIPGDVIDHILFAARDVYEVENEKLKQDIENLSGTLIPRLMEEYDNMDEEGYWDEPHPILLMAADIDRLNAKVAKLQMDNAELVYGTNAGLKHNVEDLEDCLMEAIEVVEDLTGEDYSLYTETVRPWKDTLRHVRDSKKARK